MKSKCINVRYIGTCLAIAWLCCAGGCSMLGSAKTTAPGVSATYIEKRPDGTTITKSGTATGTGTLATGEKVDQTTEAQPATITVDGITATGGGGNSRSKSTTSLTGIASPLLWVGIACMLLAAVAVWRGWNGMIIPAAGAGVLFMALAYYPQLLLWGVLALAVIVGGPYVWQYVQGKRAKEALRGVVAGVAATPPEVQVQVQAKVKEHTDQRDRATIRAVKKQDEIVMATDVPAIGANP